MHSTINELPQRDLPVLSDYDISPKTGFLPVDPPLQILPDPYFAPWEETFEQFNGLLLASRLRQRVNELPMLDAARLVTKAEQRRAYLILCMLSHAYVWGKHELAAESLPEPLAVPWQKVADMLEIQPVLTHAAVVMWNWRLLYKDGPRDLSNLDTLGTLSGSSDESWFYLVTTAIEATGAPVLIKILQAIQFAREDDVVELKLELEGIRGIIEELVAVLRRMFEKCDPYVFYWKVRPYLAGWENMAEAGLPNGVRYEGVDNGEYKKLAGGSAAQSSLIHALDIAFGVEHFPTGHRPNKPVATTAHGTAHGAAHGTHTEASTTKAAPAPTTTAPGPTNFIKKMRFYMPGPHRNFLTHLTEVANIRQYVTAKAAETERTPEIEKLIEVYDECVHQIKVFRDVHIQMVTLYIVMQANRGPSISHGGFASPAKGPAATETHEKNGSAATATATHPDAKDAAPTAPVHAGNNTSATTTNKGSSILYPQKVLFGQPYGLAKKQEAGNDVVRGTGGTDLIPFLRQSRDETNETKIVATSSMATPRKASSA
ncbi:indoleamine 2,3-dioxygenase [Entomortierella parvispora]|uniref:Indoleamine 2,3-dioxygenase n=1 Tax=Entomortierella parvispora TaxID=205924 RepID=A0A9P3M009_9FUNG|nr:indoleamine 2,3-dioxygenase [Entomortierella parvispora]